MGAYKDPMKDLLKCHVDQGNAVEEGHNYQMVASQFLSCKGFVDEGQIQRYFFAAYGRQACNNYLCRVRDTNQIAMEIERFVLWESPIETSELPPSIVAHDGTLCLSNSTLARRTGYSLCADQIIQFSECQLQPFSWFQMMELCLVVAWVPSQPYNQLHTVLFDRWKGVTPGNGSANLAWAFAKELPEEGALADLSLDKVTGSLVCLQSIVDELNNNPMKSEKKMIMAYKKALHDCVKFVDAVTPIGAQYMLHTLLLVGVLCVPPLFGTIFVMTQETSSYLHLLNQFPHMTTERGVGMLRVLARKLGLGMNDIEELLCCLEDEQCDSISDGQAKKPLFRPKSHRVAWLNGYFCWESYESGWQPFQPTQNQEEATTDRWMLHSLNSTVRISFSLGGNIITRMTTPMSGDPNHPLHPEPSQYCFAEICSVGQEASLLHSHVEEEVGEELEDSMVKLTKSKRKETGKFRVGISPFEQHAYKTSHFLSNRVPTLKEITESYYTNNIVWVSWHLLHKLRTLLQGEHAKKWSSSHSALSLQALYGKYEKLDISIHNAKGCKGVHRYYVSLCGHNFWKDQFGKGFHSPITYFGNKGVLRDGKLYFDNPKTASDFFCLSILLKLDSGKFHMVVGENRFVVLQKFGTNHGTSCLCVLFRYNKELWLGHPDDNFQCRTRVPLS
jgi:hypothetical protein